MKTPTLFDLVCLFAVLMLAAFLLTGCKNAPATKAHPPATATGGREAAQIARDSWQAAHLDAFLARVPDITKPEQVTAMLKVLRAGYTITPTPTDMTAAQKTVEAVAKGNLAASDDAAKVSAERIAALDTAITAERDASVKAEKALADERKRHAQEVADLKASWSRNLQLWTARGFVGLGSLSIVASVGAVFLFGLAAKKHAAGGTLCGLLLIAVGFAVGEPWFLWAGRVVLSLFALSLIGWGIYVARTAILERRLRTAIQDAKDEAVTGGKDAEHGWAWLKEHLAYRNPRPKTGEKSALEKEIDRRLAAEGINTPA